MKRRCGNNVISVYRRFPFIRWDLSFGNCTGCGRHLQACVCGRASRHRCVGCQSKLWKKEGKKVMWGVTIRELCATCFKLADVPEIVKYRQAL